jgi:hypothetical protein
LVFALLFFVLQVSLGFIKNHTQDVLGIQYSISVDDLLVMTNAKRQEVGASPLVLNASLSEAARNKASDMFTKNYWAHFAPDGSTSPWSFIKSAGYEYSYAGENLARGYTSASEVVDAWMASPTHRENMISANYDDVGYAVVPGMLTGDDTVLVVQMFGRKSESSSPAIAETVENPIQNSEIPKPLGTGSIQGASAPLIDATSMQRNIALVFLGTILGLLLVDLFIIRRRQVVRIISHNIDEIIFFGFVLTLVVIIGGGSIL